MGYSSTREAIGARTMKTVTAEEFNKKPAPVYREVDKNGSVLINHDRYPDKIFTLSARERNPIKEEVHDHVWEGEYEKPTS